MGKFHFWLYKALFYYRGAQRIYEPLRAYHEDTPSTSPEEALLLADIISNEMLCEEFRVHIMASLAWSTLEGTHYINFYNVRWVGTWLDSLLLEDELAAKYQIQGLYAQRLAYPQFIRDIALGWLLLKNESTADKGIEQLIRVADLLEADLRFSVGLGDPNYLSGLYGIIAGALNARGRLAEARVYEQKTTSEYINSRVASVFPGAGTVADQ